MKKIAISLIFVLVFSAVFLSGCTHESEESIKTADFMIINNFDVSPTYINLGETANLTWDVVGATTASIDNNIGTVGLSGTRIVQPTQTTVYTLTVSNATDSITLTTAIILIEGVIPGDETTIEHAPTIAFTKHYSPTGVTVVRADIDLDWSDFIITFDTNSAELNGVTLVSGIPPASSTIFAGDSIVITGTGTITIRHTPSNSLIGMWTFS